MVKHVSTLNYRAVGPRSNLDGGVGKNTFYILLFTYVSDGTLCHRSSHPKMLTLSIVKILTDFKLINPFYSNNLSLLCHSSVFFIISLRGLGTFVL